MKILGIIAIVGIIIWLAIKFHTWDEEKTMASVVV